MGKKFRKDVQIIAQLIGARRASGEEVYGGGSPRRAIKEVRP